MLAREELSGTGVGEGVAFPHAEVEGLPAPVVAFARTREGLDFDAPDGEKVRLIFMLLMPPREFERELRLLSGLARLMAQESVRRGLMEAGDVKGALAALEEGERQAKLPRSGRGGAGAPAGEDVKA